MVIYYVHIPENKLKKNSKLSPQNKYKTQNFAPAASNFSETNQIISIYNSKVGMHALYRAQICVLYM